MNHTLRRRPSGPVLTTLLATVLTFAAAVPTAAAPGTDATASPTHRRPVAGQVLVPADIPEQNWRPGHRGVDLAATPGTEIRSSAAGTVRFAGVVAGTPVVSVDHGGGLRTTYEPVLAAVRRGDHVSRGQVLGRLADAATLPETARRTPGLSWGAVIGQDATSTDPGSGSGSGSGSGGEHYIDPITLLGPVRVRLWA
jgi:biotin carboxyl carrier protein